MECCRYGVPGSSARRFEEVMRTTAPQRFEQDRDLLHHLTTLTPPPLLMHNGAFTKIASCLRLVGDATHYAACQ